MTAAYTYDGSPLTRVRARSVTLTQSAEHGSVGSGSFTYDDTAGTQDIVGQKDFSATESACATPLTFAGFIESRTYSRKSERQAAAREIDVNLVDLNAMLGFKGLHPAGNRPAETVADRGAWLMASGFVDFADNGRCDFSATVGMTASDYRTQHPGDVLADMVLAQGGVNHYIRDFGAGPELVFRDDNASTADTSSLRISNDHADQDGDTLYPFIDAQLTRSPSQVISKLAYNFATSYQIEERAATATAFNGERFGTASNSNVKDRPTAVREALAQLWQLHTEEDVIECSIQLTPEQVNLVNHGDRISAKFTHLGPEGYDEFTWFRVLECTKSSLLKATALYNVHLKLSPQEAAQPATGVVQRTFARADTSNVTATFANPLTIGNKLLVFVYKRGQALPDAPATTGPLGFWGAGAWTRLNGSSRTAVDSYFSVPAGAEFYEGLAAYYKTIDATDQTGYVPDNTVAAFELTSSANLGSATLVTKDAQTTSADPEVFNAGSLGTVAVGDLAIYCVIWVNNVNAGGYPTGYDGDFLPITSVAPGSFTERWYHGQTDTSYGPYPATYAALFWVGDLVGTGASVTASIQKAKNERNGFTFGTIGWAAIGIKIST